MLLKEIRGKVLTVLGPIGPEELGITLPHEHIFCDGSNAFFSASKDTEEFQHLPVKMENLWLIRRDSTNNLDNVRILDYDEAVKEVLLFKEEGGRTIVDVTATGLSPNHSALREVALSTGLNIIASTGYYIARSHPPSVKERSIEELAEGMKRDIEFGFGGTGIRAGIVKIAVGGTVEDGSMKILKNEEKMLRAASIVQRDSGVPITIHTPRHIPSEKERPSSWWGLRILDILKDAGANLERVIIGHLDRCYHENLDYQKEIARRGAYIEYDLWGKDFYYKAYRDANLSDAVRIENVKQLISSGCVNRLLLSQDICMKIERTAYGGHGYSHILRNIIPMMKDEAITDSEIQTMLLENTKRILTIL